MTPRLNPRARRDAIVAAAIPLFARKGFAGTTTRAIAQAAGVSEALVFKHFANKTALYDAIIQTFKGDNPSFEPLRSLLPSTHSLVHLVSATTAYFATVVDADETKQFRHRMFLRSLSEDGEFATICIESYANQLQGVFEKLFREAARAGDLIESAPDATQAFWVMARQQVMLPTWTFLAKRAGASLQVDKHARAILRAIGLKDEALRRADGDLKAFALATRHVVPDAHARPRVAL
jgi:AcrR family transcriptional regulator